MNQGKQKLISAVRRRGLSGREAARLCGCSPSAMQRYLDPNSDRLPDAALAFTIGKALGFDARLFFVSGRSVRAS